MKFCGNDFIILNVVTLDFSKFGINGKYLVYFWSCEKMKIMVQFLAHTFSYVVTLVVSQKHNRVAISFYFHKKGWIKKDGHSINFVKY
jgi:hypothetical protein